MFRASKVHPEAIIPSRANDTDAGYDLSSVEDCTVPARQRLLVSTGLAIQVPVDCYARIAPRSGLSLKGGLQVGAGVVDSGYRGIVKVLLFNHTDTDYEIKKGDRIAQIIFERIYTPSLIEEVPYEELSASDRGAGGFGSTGN